ncbi:MAG: ATP-binding protein [Gemmataceae bacterium]|nr:ATP-binding protein [Gemmataceae bacterium]MDW8267484.1 ATP-binding protein [Gemmataceae bacterium]
MRSAPVPTCWVHAERTETPASQWPWVNQPWLLPLAQHETTALAVRAPDGCPFLLAAATAVGREGLVWLEGGSEDSWTPPQRRALWLAGQTLAALWTPTPQERADRVADRLADAAVGGARLAHAFDNVLTGILGFAELALSQTPAGSASHQYLKEVLRAGQEGARLTQQLHDLARSGSFPPGSASLAEVVAEQVQTVRPLLGPQARLHWSVPATLPLAAIHPDALRLLLGQLLENARDALRDVGEINVSARALELGQQDRWAWFGRPVPGRYVELAIRDTGTGLNAAVRPRLLVQPLVTTKPRHLGLGLAIVARIVLSCGGGLRLEDNSEGGTLVCVLLPLARTTLGITRPAS